MVLGICRRILVDPHDAEDAFQATFLVLVRKASSIARRELLGNWLYGVAYRTAKEAKARAARRRAKEEHVVDDVPQAGLTRDDADHDLRDALDEELIRLPERYRLPLVLCDLEGGSRRDVARRLGLPEGTVSSRLARGRGLLRERLTRRGLTLSAGAVAAAITRDSASATVPAHLIDSTVRAATQLAAGSTAMAGAVSASVSTLMEGVLKTMLLSKLKVMAITLLTMGILTSSAIVLAQQGPATREESPPREAQLKDVERKLDRIIQALEGSPPQGRTETTKRKPASPGDGAMTSGRSVFDLQRSLPEERPRTDSERLANVEQRLVHVEKQIERIMQRIDGSPGQGLREDPFQNRILGDRLPENQDKAQHEGARRERLTDAPRNRLNDSSPFIRSETKNNTPEGTSREAKR
jgi:RNA polymerase sigma factor (sigma-70 family)